MPIGQIATLGDDFKAGLITDSNPEVGLSRARNILFLEKGITKAPSYQDAFLKIGTRTNKKLDYGEAFVQSESTKIWWRMSGGKVFQIIILHKRLFNILQAFHRLL